MNEEEPAMAGLGEATEGGDQPFMVSSLPLVFCDGHPVAIENMPDVSICRGVELVARLFGRDILS